MSTIKTKNIQQTVISGTTQPLKIGGILEDGSDAKISIGSDGTTIVNATSASFTTLNINSRSAYVCRAWANYSGGTAIRGSQNVSSITDTGVGTSTVNFITPMPNTNYVPIIPNSQTNEEAYIGNIATLTVNSFTVVRRYAGNPYDSDSNYIAVFC